jgi:hypothetical protein
MTKKEALELLHDNNFDCVSISDMNCIDCVLRDGCLESIKNYDTSHVSITSVSSFTNLIVYYRINVIKNF